MSALPVIIVKSQDVPLNFADVGKDVRDFLEKEFPVAQEKLEFKARSLDNVQFNITGTRDAKTDAISADFKAVHAFPRGVTLTQKWSTDNILTGEISVADSLVRGLTLGTEVVSNNSLRKYNAKITAAYQQQYINNKMTVDLARGPLISNEFLVGKAGVFAGADVGYDVKNSAVYKYDLAATLRRPDYSMSLMVKRQLNLFNMYYNHRVAEDVVANANIQWDKSIVSDKSNSILMEFGAKYRAMEGLYKAKVDSLGRVGLSFQRPILPRVVLTVGCRIDTRNLDVSGRQLGLTLSFI